MNPVDSKIEILNSYLAEILEIYGISNYRNYGRIIRTLDDNALKPKVTVNGVEKLFTYEDIYKLNSAWDIGQQYTPINPVTMSVPLSLIVNCNTSSLEDIDIQGLLAVKLPYADKSLTLSSVVLTERNVYTGYAVTDGFLDIRPRHCFRLNFNAVIDFLIYKNLKVCQN